MKRLVLAAAVAAAMGAEARTVTSLNGNAWTLDGVPVCVPHTWNVGDGADGEPSGLKPQNTGDSVRGTGYTRRVATYRRALPDPTAGKRLFVRFAGGANKTEVFVNGRSAGLHKGFMTGFTYEITSLLKPTGNVLEVVADSTLDDLIPPLSADYTVYGGLYRDVDLIETDAVCIDPTVLGGPGVTIEPDAQTGRVKVTVLVSGADDAKLAYRVKTPDGAELRFGTDEFAVPSPHLWSPEDPALYTLTVELEKGESRDAVVQRFGFRTVEFRADGFYLNGRKRKLRGVNRHQDVGGRGWAATAEDDALDIRIMKDMGIDALRLTHYPQSPRMYDLLDEAGILVWSEIPAINDLTEDPAFYTNLLTIAKEELAQHRNHPCVAMWSLFNELYNGRTWKRPDGFTEDYIEGVKAEMKKIDSSRPYVGATCKIPRRRLNDIPDELGYNIYPGWYNKKTLDQLIDTLLSSNRHTRLAISEYGGGASIHHHQNPARAYLNPLSRFHPEERQTEIHIDDFRVINRRDDVWGSFVWAMFDFAADARFEGERNGINDKGLVTRDRQYPKDAYYLYRANWNPAPQLHLCGKRMTETTNDVCDIVGFCNAGPVTLYVDEMEIGTQTPDEIKVVAWRDVTLPKGRTKITLRCGELKDECVWRSRQPETTALDRPDAQPKEVPELMKTFDGRPVTTLEDWENVRRPEILELFTRDLYGRRPAERPADLAFAAAEPDKVMMDGKALRKRVTASWSGPKGSQSFTFTAFIPTAKKTSPAFLLICNRPPDENIDPERVKKSEFWPAEEIVDRGYAAIAFWNGDIAPDRYNGFTNGVYTCFQDPEERTDESWGAISAWAWGASRVMDWIETEPSLDAKRVAVVGHSRGGKTALWTGVTDTRFAMACPNCSGCAGVKLNHIELPKSESYYRISNMFRHWFSRRFDALAGQERKLGFDTHELLALMAPRLLAVGDATLDNWAGQPGEYWACRYASPAWKLYGKTGFVGGEGFPAPETPLQDGDVSFHLHVGIHTLNTYDWNRYMDFADRHGWQK